MYCRGSLREEVSKGNGKCVSILHGPGSHLLGALGVGLLSPSLQILKMWLGLKRFVDQASASPTPTLPLFLVTLRREFG